MFTGCNDKAEITYNKFKIDMKRNLGVFSVREWREGVSWKFVFCPSQRDFRETIKTKSHLSRGKVHTGLARAAFWPI